jgi:two-component system sensor histidine kinase DesK
MTKQSISTDNDDYVSQWADRTRGPGFALVWLPVLMLSPILTAILDGDLTALTIHLAITVLYVVTILVAHNSLPQRVGELCTAGLMALVVVQFIVSLGGQGFLYPLARHCSRHPPSGSAQHSGSSWAWRSADPSPRGSRQCR